MMSENIMVMSVVNKYLLKAHDEFKIIIPYRGFDIGVEKIGVKVYFDNGDSTSFSVPRPDGNAIKSCMDYIDSKNRNGSESSIDGFNRSIGD
jgi:hypothetical protein